MSDATHTARGPVGRSALRTKLDAGEVAIVVAGSSLDADQIDLVGSCGFEAVWVEGEHGRFTWDRLGDLSRAAELWGMATMLRVRRLDPSLIARGLTLGATGIVVPQVSSVAEAELAVRASRFAPDGIRGVSRGRRSYRSPGSPPSDWFAEENANVVVVVQLEDPHVLNDIEALGAIPGLDVIFVAPNDLAQAMGRQGQLDHPEVVAAIDDAITRIAATGKAPGTLCRAEHIDRFVGLGARLLYVSLDDWIRAGAADYRRRVAAAVTPSN